MVKKRNLILSVVVASVLLGSLFYVSITLAGKPAPQPDQVEVVNFPLDEEGNLEATIKHSYYEWYIHDVLLPHQFYTFENSTVGYKEVTLHFMSNRTARITVYWEQLGGSRFSIDVQEESTFLKTYPVKSGRICVQITNFWDTPTVDFMLNVYVTT